MKNFLLVAGFAFAASGVQAGPFGLFGRRGVSTGNHGGAQYAAPVRTQGPIAHSLGTAAGVAAYMASLGRIGHFGGNPYAAEGVGMGPTPDSAVRNCCYYGKRPIADQGVCQGANGYWYACCRYN